MCIRDSTRAVRMTLDLAQIQDLAKIEKSEEDREGGLSWPRIVGLSFAIAIHAAALLLLLAPISPPAQDVEEDDVVLSLIHI